jgi:hypothetical protein
MLWFDSTRESVVSAQCALRFPSKAELPASFGACCPSVSVFRTTSGTLSFPERTEGWGPFCRAAHPLRNPAPACALQETFRNKGNVKGSTGLRGTQSYRWREIPSQCLFIAQTGWPVHLACSVNYYCFTFAFWPESLPLGPKCPSLLVR